jgi:DNA mismatch endonuclease (patch repair protein)
MSLVKGKGNKSTEGKVLSLFRAKRICGWRRHLPLPGRPDFSFEKERVAIFLDGCFWHGCKRCYRSPKSNTSFWSKKLRENVTRDQRLRRQLRSRGWKVVRIWEHSLRNIDSVETKILLALEH